MSTTGGRDLRPVRPASVTAAPTAATPASRPSAGRYALTVACGVVTWPAPPASITAVTTASTIAPPIWKDVWSRLAAMPCSLSATPAVAIRLSEEYPSPKANPMRTIAGSMTDG